MGSPNQRYMAAHHRRGHARKPKNHKFCHSADLLDCSWVGHSTDQQGELPLMEDVGSWKEGRQLSIVKASGDHARFKQKQISNEQIPANSRRRLYGTEKKIEAGALKTGARRYVLRHSSAFHTERDSSRLKMGAAFQVDCYQLEHPLLSLANHLWDNKGVLADDDFSLDHWLNSGCKRKNASMSNLQGQKVTKDARESRSSELTRGRRDLSRTHRCGLFHKQHMKKRKLSTSIENCQLLPQNVEAFWPLISNSYSRHFHHHSQSLKVKEPILVQKEHASRTEAHKSDDSFQCQLPFVTEHTAKIESQKVRNEFSRARLFALQDVKLPFCDDELNVPQQPGGGKSKPWRRSTGNSQRKTLPNSSRTPHFSELSIRNRGCSRVVKAKAKRESQHESMLEVLNKQETEAMFAPVESLACSSKNYTLDVGASVKDVDGSSGSGKLAANRQTLKKGSRNSTFDTQEEHGHSSSPSLRSKVRSLSQKYRPKVLQDLIGQNFVARALSNAISKGKVAPVYLFQGSHGTGKTSAARIFAMALNCTTPEERKPCGLCNECTALISGNTSYVWELDAASHNGIGLVHELIESIDFATPDPPYKIVIIDECHMFSCETWSALIKLFEKPSSNAVFILITTEPDKLPRSITSRFQRFHFLQIKHSDIVNRLDHIAKLENIFTEPGALSLIASKSDGSLRSAETILDQVSLLEQRITLATIHKLVGSVSDDKLMRLLDVALCSDMVRTVQKTRKIVDFGVDPLDLLSQLATLITDILAGSYAPMGTSEKEGCSMHALTDLEMERLRTALRILSEAERQVRAVSPSRTTWLLAALLQMGPTFQHNSEAAILSKNLAKASSGTLLTLKRAKGIKLRVRGEGRDVSKRSVSTEMVLGEKSHGFEAPVTDRLSKSELERSVDSKLESSVDSKLESSLDSANRLDPPQKLSLSTVEGSSSVANEEIHIHLSSPSNVGSLWLNVLKCCKPLSVRHLLHNHGQLLALTFSAVNIVAHVVFEKPAEKITAEMYHVCITNSFKKVLGPSVKVQFSLASDLQGADRASCPAAIADASCTQSTFKHSPGCEVYGQQIEKESFDVKSSTCPAIVVPPLENRSSSPSLSRGSSHFFCGAETTILTTLLKNFQSFGKKGIFNAVLC